MLLLSRNRDNKFRDNGESMNDIDLSLKLFLALNKATQSVMKRVEADIKQHGLIPTEFAVLEMLYHKGEQPIQKIGSKVLITSSSITYVVDKLEKKGYLVRKSCPEDRRVTYAVLTEEGKELIAEYFPKHQAMLQQLMSGLDNNEKEKMITLLKTLGTHIEGL